MATLRELRVVQQINAAAGTRHVSVKVRDGRVLAIAVGHADVSGKPEAERQALFRRVATAAYLAFPSRAQIDAVIVEATATAPHRFRPIELIEPSGLAEHWVKPNNSPNQLYFVAMGHVRFDLVTELATHFRQTLGIDIVELPAMPFDRATVDDDRSQVVAEELVAAIGRRYPVMARDSHVRIIGVTGDDMYLREMATSWAFGFSWRSGDHHLAVVSYARMDPAALGLSADPEMLRSRVTKMVAKNIGIMYYGLPLSENPRSALYGNIGGSDELDVMTEYFDPQATIAPIK